MLILPRARVLTAASRVSLLIRHTNNPVYAKRMASSSIPDRMKAIQIHEQGGLDVMKLEEVPTPKPEAGQVLLKVEYAG